MTDTVPPDASARSSALDPEASFIVQAPAGSGKTELLTQRYLRLLARVGDPEEIIAITFTRKAAAEMRGRIIGALEAGLAEDPPGEPHARTTWELARAALARDRDAGWQLRDYPGRLRIQTIDALCASLTRQMPLGAGFGAQPAITDRPETFYAEAARATVSAVEAQDDWADAVAVVLDHLANDIPALERLLAAMLARRDQWLPHVRTEVSGSLRAAMEETLRGIVERGLEQAAAHLPAGVAQALPEVVRFAAARCPDDSPVALLREAPGLPGTAAGDYPGWRALATLMLTVNGEPRKTANIRQGFPPPSQSGVDPAEKTARQEMKRLMADLLGDFAADEGAVRALAHVSELPPPEYPDAQWTVTEALVRVLRLAAAHLRLVFAREGVVDFAEVSAGALAALGEPDQPTDLALSLDYRIRHLLLDEFQDTSQMQYALLLRLTAGWEAGDGRTLFLVGDPMQSIYRFREAEVGLFLRARQEGIGTCRLRPLTLTSNFRSAPTVVEWCNTAFHGLMPDEEDIATGAVGYSPAQAVRHDLAGDGVVCRPLVDADENDEAGEVVNAVMKALEQSAEASVAVLVRARTHAARIALALRKAGIGYQAVELDALASRPVIRDLRALTRALIHPGDRLAWLSLLRAPWCGLALTDLTAIAGDDRSQRPIVSAIADAVSHDSLSDGARQRIARFLAIMGPAIESRRRLPLHRQVEAVWLGLGGPAAYTDARSVDDATVFLDLLARRQEGGDLADPDELDRDIARLFAQPDTRAAHPVQIMTMHRAKGLEFDTVILPGLGRAARAGDQPLMRWMELPRRSGGISDLLLAPVRRTGAETGPIYRYLGGLERSRDELETIRLLYVAATRARRTLYLIGSAGRDRDGEPKPRAGALLQKLWPVVGSTWTNEACVPEATPPDTAGRREPPCLMRFPLDWSVPAPPCNVPTRVGAGVGVAEEDVEYLWAGDVARHTGTAVHRVLQRIAAEGPGEWTPERLAGEAAAIDRHLETLGVPPTTRAAARERVLDALRRTLEDPRGRWILEADPARDPVSEIALSGRVEGRLVNATIDRAFVDEQGVRWVVDYKTGGHEGGDIDRFLATEMERYREQIAQYCALYRLLEERPVRGALYFPLLGRWCEYGAPR